MTRRKRTPSPPPSRKPAPLQIPASLLQLSAISRSLALQADTLSGAASEQRDGLLIERAQRLATQATTTTVNEAHPQTSRPTFQKFVRQKQIFPEAQTWVETQPRRDRTSNHAYDIPPSPAGSFEAPPSSTPELHSEFRLPIQAPSEPVAKQGEPLCLATQPSQIAALIAKKRAENEANKQRAKWAQKQSQHRRSQAPDDQLQNELNSEVETQPLTEMPASLSRSDTHEMEAPEVAPASEEDGVQQLQDYALAHDDNTEIVMEASSTLENGGGQATATTQATLLPCSDTAEISYISHRNRLLFSSGPVNGAQSIHPQQAFFWNPVHSYYPPPPTYPSPHTQVAIQPTMNDPSQGPGYYKIDMRLWSEPSLPQPTYAPYYINPRPRPRPPKAFRNLTQEGFGRSSVDGKLTDGLDAGISSETHTRRAKRPRT